MQSKKSIKIIMIVLGLMVLTAGIIMAVRFFSKKPIPTVPSRSIN